MSTRVRVWCRGHNQFIESSENLALKLVSGSLGEGFYKLTFDDNFYYVNTEKTSIEDLKKLLYELKGYLVTEYIKSHKDISRIYDATPNTLRVLIIRKNNEAPRITGSFIDVRI